MAARNDGLKDRLSRSREINITGDRKKIRTPGSQSRSGSYGRMTSFTSCR